MWQVLDNEGGDVLFKYARKKALKASASGLPASADNHQQQGNSCSWRFEGLEDTSNAVAAAHGAVQDLGANPIPIEFAELYNALQQKTVDGQENPIGTITLQKYYEVQNYLMLSNHGFLLYALVANLDWYNSLPAEYQEMIQEAGKVAAEVQRQSLRDKETGYMEQIKETGIKIVEFSDADRAAFVEASKPIHETFANTPSKQEVLNTILEAIEKYQ